MLNLIDKMHGYPGFEYMLVFTVLVAVATLVVVAVIDVV